VVFNPSDLARTGKLRYQKTDVLDARLICKELRDGRLKGITVPDTEREHLRCLFRRRNDLVKDYRRIKSHIKSQLLYLGIKLPPEYDNPNWSHAFRDWIRDLSFDYPTVEAALESRMEHYEYIDKELRYISNELRKWCRTHYKKDYRLLRRDPVMQAYYRTHTGKDTKAILVKVARKLLSRTLAVIKTETPYQVGVIE
jgi:transposase